MLGGATRKIPSSSGAREHTLAVIGARMFNVQNAKRLPDSGRTWRIWQVGACKGQVPVLAFRTLHTHVVGGLRASAVDDS